jgi:hypothetical protein
MECSAGHRFDADSHQVLVRRPQPGTQGAATEDRELVRMGYLSGDTLDEHAPAFMIGRPALIGLKSHVFAEAQPTELAPLCRTEDDVTVQQREVDWNDDRHAVCHVTNAADDRSPQELKAFLSREGRELGLVKLTHLRTLLTHISPLRAVAVGANRLIASASSIPYCGSREAC